MGINSFERSQAESLATELPIKKYVANKRPGSAEYEKCVVCLH